MKRFVHEIVFAIALASMAALHIHEAHADEAWVYEFEFDFGIPDYLDRLLQPSCSKVVPVGYVQWYAINPQQGWEISCGNNQPMFQHFLGRQCWRPLPKLRMECGWRHFSSPHDGHEISFDAFAVRGRFTW